MQNIDELNMKFSCRVLITIKWRDGRLFFKNLLNESNTLDNDDIATIWKPPLRLSNSLNLENILKNEYILIEIIKKQLGKLTDEQELHESMIYDGKENDLIMTATYETDFTCSYDLQDYPFDSQICSIDVSGPINLQNEIELIPSVIKYTGLSKTLPQFQFSINKIQGNENGTLVQGFIHLIRIPFYHILCTYIPTCCILTIAVVTMFIDESHFEATIAVALTAMLVLYTLFQSISANMPPTAYLKFLDIWLIFCLIMPFIIFLIEVAWELSQQKQNNEVKSLHSNTQSFKAKSKIFLLIGIPLLCGIFFIIYVIIAFSKYYR